MCLEFQEYKLHDEPQSGEGFKIVRIDTNNHNKFYPFWSWFWKGGSGGAGCVNHRNIPLRSLWKTKNFYTIGRTSIVRHKRYAFVGGGTEGPDATPYRAGFHLYKTLDRAKSILKFEVGLNYCQGYAIIKAAYSHSIAEDLVAIVALRIKPIEVVLKGAEWDGTL